MSYIVSPPARFSASESIEDFICSFRIQHHEHPLMDPSNSKINHSMDAFRANFILLDLSSQSLCQCHELL